MAKKQPIQYKDLANCIRFLSMDAVQRANSGHPGMPMGMADVATILFAEFLRFDPISPKWMNRDRFILSAGHGSMLLYSILHLTGYKDVEIDDIKNFRQLHSKTAGHPEYGELEAIETTTGPLGQGLANGVGMALSEKIMKERLGQDLIDHKTYIVVGDGCLMEGISQESISLAGHLALNNLIVLWDDNSISIDGNTNLATSENMQARFEACGWKFLSCDGHNHDDIRKALSDAQNSDKPVLIGCKTKIGYGSITKEGSEKSHGAPLGEEEISKIRKKLNWNYSAFVIPEDLKEYWKKDIGKRSRKESRAWEDNFNALPQAKKDEIKRIERKELSPEFIKKLEQLKQKIFLEKPKQATRKSSQEVLEFLTENLPEIVGGSADLTGSVLTKTSHISAISKNNYGGRYVHYGVREHAMAAIMNGMSLHGSILPYSGTFLVFSDYMKPAIRLSALMKQRVIYVLTHDSIGLGEDGPTHQPVEHLAMLRGIPNLYVFRPADAQETLGCYEQALKYKDGPSAMVLTRQNVEFLRSEYKNSQSFCSRGAYVISESALDIEPDVIIIATGSEVKLAIDTKEKLNHEGLAVRVVSMPCFELFDKQDQAYQNKILGTGNILKVAIEASILQGWNRYIGDDGLFVGMEGFGASGKAEDLFKYFKMEPEKIALRVMKEVRSRRRRAIKSYRDKDDYLDEIDRYKEEALKDIDD